MYVRYRKGQGHHNKKGLSLEGNPRTVDECVNLSYGGKEGSENFETGLGF